MAITPILCASEMVTEDLDYVAQAAGHKFWGYMRSDATQNTFIALMRWLWVCSILQRLTRPKCVPPSLLLLPYLHLSCHVLSQPGGVVSYQSMHSWRKLPQHTTISWSRQRSLQIAKRSPSSACSSQAESHGICAVSTCHPHTPTHPLPTLCKLC